MATLREYFETEASEYLNQMRAALAGGVGAGTPTEMYRLARGLRGTAQMAREERVYRVALAIESALRTAGAAAHVWGDALRERMEPTIADLRVLVAAGEADDVADARTAGALARWPAAGNATPAAPPPAPAAAAHEFMSFAARECAGLVEELERGTAAFAADGRDREALLSVLRRQRALLGSTRLADIPVVAETLRAVEDLTRIIVKLDVAVKDEWLDVFRSARETLRAAAPALANGEQPGHSNSLSRLRTLREELLDRFGVPASRPESDPADDPFAMPAADSSPAPSAPPTATPAAPPVAAAPPAFAAAAPAAAAPVMTAPAATTSNVQPSVNAMTPTAPVPSTPAAASGAEVVVDIQTLCYRGEAALRAALELRAQLEAAVETDPDARDVVDEVFDLIRLGIG